MLPGGRGPGAPESRCRTPRVAGRSARRRWRTPARRSADAFVPRPLESSRSRRVSIAWPNGEASKSSPAGMASKKALRCAECRPGTPPPPPGPPTTSREQLADRAIPTANTAGQRRRAPGAGPAGARADQVSRDNGRRQHEHPAQVLVRVDGRADGRASSSVYVSFGPGRVAQYCPLAGGIAELAEQG